MKKRNDEFKEVGTFLSQRDKLIRHLNDFGTITTLEAFRDYGIMRPSARISEIKQRGYQVRTEMVKGVNRYGEPIRYARYVHEKEDER